MFLTLSTRTCQQSPVLFSTGSRAISIAPLPTRQVLLPPEVEGSAGCVQKLPSGSCLARIRTRDMAVAFREKTLKLTELAAGSVL